MLIGSGSVIDAASIYSLSDSSLQLSRSIQIKTQIEKTFLMDRNKSEWDWVVLVQNSIIQANPKLTGLSDTKAIQLSKQLVRTCSCYGVDPGVFAALVWRESNFKPEAVSERGAVGYTQMTKLGVQEILERVSPYSSRRLKFLSSAFKRCNPSLAKKLPRTISADTVAASKNQLMQSPEQSIVFGVLLLKLNLAYSPQRKNFSERYRLALERYNGDAKVKLKFARDVLSLRNRLMSQVYLSSNKNRLVLSDLKSQKSIAQF